MNNKTNKEARTRAWHENYILKTEITNPTHYEEAMLIQHLNINARQNKLVQKMAKCELVDGSKILPIFKEQFEKAKACQDTKGSKARWRRASWTATNRAGSS